MSRAAVFGAKGLRLTAGEKQFFQDSDPWGFILFARNIDTPAQVRALTSELRDSVGRDCLVMIDQEGGRVARLRAPHWREWPDPLDQMAVNASAEAIYLRYRIIGAELRDVGIDANCVPVLDVARKETHPFLKSRCFGFDVETVAKAGHACAQGTLSAGVLPVIKHIPGHGLGTVDSHNDLPRVSASLDALRELDFKPFEALSDHALGMTSHVVYSAIDDERPGTQSKPVVDLIRSEIGFQGLLLTDDLSMNALSGSHADRAIRAKSAGCDIILHCNGEMEQMQEICEVVPKLAGEAARRADAAINSRQPQDVVDIDAAMSEYSLMMKMDS